MNQPEDLEETWRKIEEQNYFLTLNLGAESHWFFSQGVSALHQGLIIPACCSFLIGIEATLRVVIQRINDKSGAIKLDPRKILSNKLLIDAQKLGLPVHLLAFSTEDDFQLKLNDTTTKANVELVRVRHNLCHGNIFEYLITDEDLGFPIFTPECCSNLSRELHLVSRRWAKGLSDFIEAGNSAGLFSDRE